MEAIPSKFALSPLQINGRKQTARPSTKEIISGQNASKSEHTRILYLYSIYII